MSTHASDHLTASFRLGVHVGAAYTDVPLVDRVSGRTWAETASTPAGQAVGVLTGVGKVCKPASGSARSGRCTRIISSMVRAIWSAFVVVTALPPPRRN
ncbi:MAG: hypothetical protein J2P20_13185, partial [Pseudonocardia sp.]|nr:hypothetical protein [Pseudonocardia sp.]